LGEKVYPDKDLLSTIKSIKMENGFKEAKIMEPAKISVYSIVGSSHCVLAEDGERVYEKIKEALEKEKHVELSFLNIELLTSAFLNAAIGRLYENFPEEKIRKSLFLRNISDKDRELIKRVVNTVKIYQRSPELLAKVIKEFLSK
jgi:hypothetical protein